MSAITWTMWSSFNSKVLRRDGVVLFWLAMDRTLGRRLGSGSGIQVFKRLSNILTECAWLPLWFQDRDMEPFILLGHFTPLER